MTFINFLKTCFKFTFSTIPGQKNVAFETQIKIAKFVRSGDINLSSN